MGGGLSAFEVVEAADVPVADDTRAADVVQAARDDPAEAERLGELKPFAGRLDRPLGVLGEHRDARDLAQQVGAERDGLGRGERERPLEAAVDLGAVATDQVDAGTQRLGLRGALRVAERQQAVAAPRRGRRRRGVASSSRLRPYRSRSAGRSSSSAGHSASAPS